MTEEYKEKGYRFVKTFLSDVIKVILAVSAVLALGILIYNLVDSRIERIVNDEQFIRKVAANIRPYVIFDEKGAILVDGGASEHLEEIKVTTRKEGNIISVEIIVTPKHHLAYAPLIEKLEAGRSMLTPETKRGPGHQWTYEFEVVHWAEDPAPARFRLEILK